MAEIHPTKGSSRDVGEKARSGMDGVISAQDLSSALELSASVLKALHYSRIPQLLPLNWLVSGSDLGQALLYNMREIILEDRIIFQSRKTGVSQAEPLYSVNTLLGVFHALFH